MNRNALHFFLVLFLVIFSNCMRHEYLIEYDYDYGGNFKKYNSFYFMHNARIDQDSSQIAFNPLLEEAIKNRMEILGYKFSKEKPRLLVAYSIYYDNMKFRGYNQPELEKWLEQNTDEDRYDPIKLELKEGTILVQLIDTKRNNTVWQGYASGVFGNSYTSNERYIKRAVRSIFEQYRVMAEGFDISQRKNASL